MSTYLRGPAPAGKAPPAATALASDPHALGAGIPAVAHDFLNSLPLDRWEREKDKYVYETWLREAKRQLREAER